MKEKKNVPAANTSKTAKDAAAGQELDLERLFQEHHSRVFGTAYRITGNASDAEDVLQTVFMRLLRREDDLDLSSSAGGYLRRAAVNASLDLLRSRKRARAVALDDVAPVLAEAEAKGPERRSHGREIKDWLRQEVAKLSPRAAEIFSLRYIEGYANQEIAEMLGTSQTAVGVTLHRSRNRLKTELLPLLGGAS